MKKTITVIALIIVLTVSCFALVACKDDASDLHDFVIAEKTYKIGDVYASGDITVTATANEKTYNVDKNLVFVGDDADALKLDKDGKFTEAGTYTVKVYTVEERDDMYVGEWKIVVED